MVDKMIERSPGRNAHGKKNRVHIPQREQPTNRGALILGIKEGQLSIRRKDLDIFALGKEA